MPETSAPMVGVSASIRNGADDAEDGDGFGMAIPGL